jgi:hypothetical protein
MIRMGQVQHSIADQHHQLSVLAKKRARKRAIVGFDDHAVSDPLPELLLGGPEFLAIAANNQRRFLLFLFLFFLSHSIRTVTLPAFLTVGLLTPETPNTLSPYACSSLNLDSKTRSDPEGKPHY